MNNPTRLTMIDPNNCKASERDVLAARGPQGNVNIFRMFANNPPFLDALIPLTTYIFQNSTLPPRDRELMVLRCGWAAQAEYVWAQHTRLGRSVGVSDEEIARVKAGGGAEGWSEHDRALINAVDEIHRHNMISDATWATLARRLTAPQLMDVIFVIGQTLMIASAARTLSIPLDEGLTGFV